MLKFNFIKMYFKLKSIFKQKDDTKILGRWIRIYDPKKLDIVIKNTNEDHCGSCGLTKLRNHDNKF
jgi:hypothetical protein